MQKRKQKQKLMKQKQKQKQKKQRQEYGMPILSLHNANVVVTMDVAVRTST